MKKTIMMLLVFILGINVSNSQDNNESNNALIIPKAEVLNSKLGFAASMLSGYGLSYELNVSNMNTLEFTASIYGEGGSDNSTSYLVATMGAEFQRNMFKSGDSRFYALAAVSYWIDNNNGSSKTTYYYSNSQYIKYNESSYSIGLGIGWEITLAKRIVLNLEGGYRYNSINASGTESLYDKSGNYYPSDFIDRTSYKLGFGAGGGVYYSF